MSDDQGNPSSGSTMWRSLGPGQGLYSALCLIPNSQPSQPTAVGFIFHPNQCLNPKWSLNIFSYLSRMREPAVGRVKQTGDKFQLWALRAGWHKKSYCNTLSFNLFSVNGRLRTYLISLLWWFNGLTGVRPPGQRQTQSSRCQVNFSQLPVQAMKIYRSEILHEWMFSRELNLLKITIYYIYQRPKLILIILFDGCIILMILGDSSMFAMIRDLSNTK